VLVFREFDGEIKARHGQQLEIVLADYRGRCRQVSIEMAHGHADDFTMQVEVINDYNNNNIIEKVQIESKTVKEERL
jgi:hypothetical protein